jgi:ribose transport system permease protein
MARGWSAASTQKSSLGPALLIVGSWTIFGIIGAGFLGSINLYSIGQLGARDAVLGMAQAMLLTVGRMNLAVGGVGAVCVSLMGYLVVSVKIPLAVAIAIVLVVGVVASVIMAMVELLTGLSSFVVTLAFLSIYTGGALLVTNGAQYQISTSSALNQLGNGSLLWSRVCPTVVLALIVGAGVWLLFNRNSLGWKMLSVGANERVSRASGISVSRVVVSAYVLSGLLCAIAAIMDSSYQLTLNAGFGADWLLPSFIAAVLGGVALSGGEVSVLGIGLAALFYDSLQSGLTIVNIPTYWLELGEGLILLGAVLAFNAEWSSIFWTRRARALIKAEESTGVAA